MPKFKLSLATASTAIILTIVLISSGLLLAVLADDIDLPDGPRTASACTQTWPIAVPSDIIPTVVQPTKIVVQPWKGRHHVYAEFPLPSHSYYVNDRFRVNFGNLGDFCGGVTSPDNPNSQPVAIARLRTRTALWLISQGQLNALNQAQNWQLEIIPREKLPTAHSGF